MAFTYKLPDHIKKNAWLRSLSQAIDPSLIATMIENRINNPNQIGPYYYFNNRDGEQPTDIISALIIESAEFRQKATPAISMIIYKFFKEGVKEDIVILSSVFEIVKNAKIKECHKLLYGWLQQNNSRLNNINCDEGKKSLYRNAMVAFAEIQEKKLDIENYWLNIWNANDPYWLVASFTGLRKQNPIMACKEIKTLIFRDTSKTKYLLSNTWKDEKCRSFLIEKIKEGLEKTDGWAGKAINDLYDVLDYRDKHILMSSLKEKISASKEQNISKLN